MSITEELRAYTKHYSVAGSKKDTMLSSIADRIDAEHQKAEDEWRAKNGDMWLKGYAACHEELMEGHPVIAADLEKAGWVRLPVDADGVPIRVGDVMDSKVDYLFDGKPFTVRALVLCEDGWEASDGRFGNRYEPNSLRHHHAPTVEDVLREFADEMNQNLGMYTGEAIDADEWRDADNKTIAEFAAKLRLAEEVDG